MYKIKIDGEEIGDLITLLLFDKMMDSDFMDNSEIFNQLGKTLNDKNLKSKLFGLYFDLSVTVRSKYHSFKKNLQEHGATIQIINKK